VPRLSAAPLIGMNEMDPLRERLESMLDMAWDAYNREKEEGDGDGSGAYAHAISYEDHGTFLTVSPHFRSVWYATAKRESVRYSIHIGTEASGTPMAHYVMEVRLVDPTSNYGFNLEDQLFEISPAGIDSLIQALLEVFNHKLNREFTERMYAELTRPPPKKWEMRTALAMALHPRLGAQSRLGSLGEDIVSNLRL
jgi:hypothetical protein